MKQLKKLFIITLIMGVFVSTDISSMNIFSTEIDPIENQLTSDKDEQTFNN